ncbi:MAG: hypothetical protein IPK58_10030 [Acidobacteria bacterium]|nr:hypothetical protein [Acidobacteriota bacterium]
MGFGIGDWGLGIWDSRFQIPDSRYSRFQLRFQIANPKSQISQIPSIPDSRFQIVGTICGRGCVKTPFGFMNCH